MRQLYGVLVLLILGGSPLFGQDSLDLAACIDYAWQHNPQIKQAGIQQRQAELSRKQASWAFYPTLNASFRHGLNLGRSIDFTSYQYVNQSTQSSQLSLNTNFPIYQGLRLRNQLKQSRLDVQATAQDLEQAKQTNALSVAQAYLQVLLAEENLQVLQAQKALTEEQLAQTLKQIKAGNLPDNSRLELEAQQARDEQAIVNAENTIELAYVNLKVLINMPVDEKIRLKVIELQLPEARALETLDELYLEAAANMPNMAANRLREESADMAIKVAEGALMPSLSGYASLTSNYSSAAKDRTTEQTTQTLFLDVNGTQVPLEFPTVRTIEGGTTPYFEQVGNNLYTNVGINLSIPIFNGFQSRIAIERAKLNLELAKLNSSQAQNQLKADIQRALTDVKAARKSLEAAQKSLTATSASAANTRKRFELGIVNGFELSSVQNMLTSAASSVLQAKYDLLFKLKVLDFYRGIGLNTPQEN